MANKQRGFKTKNVYKQSREKEDSDIELKGRVIKINELTEFKGTPLQFIKKIRRDYTGYIHVNGEGLLHLWWEDKDEWFMNTAHQNMKKIKKGGWFIAKDLEGIITRYMDRNAKLYFYNK